MAAGAGACQATASLLELRADAAAAANDGETPLHLAAAEGHTAAVRLLVEARAEVDHASADGETPLHVAVQHVGGKPTLGHIQALLELRADPSRKDGGGHDAYESAGLYTNRADEIRALLKGSAPKGDPEDPWPDSLAELPQGTAPLTAAEGLKELGNRRFKEGRYEEAVKLYFKAKLFLPTGPAAHAPVAEGDAEGARARECYLAVSSNAAMCKLKQGEHDVCARMCDAVLALDASNVKARYRKALALRAQGDAEEAETVLKEALELDPADAAIQKELTDIARQRRKDKENEKRLAKKMFG